MTIRSRPAWRSAALQPMKSPRVPPSKRRRSRAPRAGPHGRCSGSAVGRRAGGDRLQREVGHGRAAAADGQANRAQGRVDSAGASVGVQRHGQRHQPFCCCRRAILRGHGLEPAVRLAAAERGADGRGQGLAVRRGECPHTVEFGRVERTAAVRGQPGSASGGRVRARRSASVMVQGQKERRSWGAWPRFSAQAVR